MTTATSPPPTRSLMPDQVLDQAAELLLAVADAASMTAATPGCRGAPCAAAALWSWTIRTGPPC